MNQISLGMGDMELFEAYIRMYLDEAQMLVKRGLRSAYEEKTDNLRCFRGKQENFFCFLTGYRNPWITARILHR